MLINKTHLSSKVKNYHQTIIIALKPFFFFGGGAQWEKSNKFVPLGKMKKIIFLHQFKFV
jgi:hypothetical protein